MTTPAPLAAASIPPLGADPSARLLAAARGIGQRLVDTAVWEPDGGGCTWRSLELGAAPEQMIGTGLYKGTAGIALFLALIARETGEGQFAEVADGALRTSERAAGTSQRPLFGLYSGPIGTAYALVQFGQWTGDRTATARALAQVGSLRGRETEDTVLDVIGGAAGAIPALLDLQGRTGAQWMGEMAGRLGRLLVIRARKGPRGWSWAPGPATNAFDLTGYAHGSAGCGLALLELYRATGDPDFRYGARRAFAYEDAFYVSDVLNWPDFRRMNLTSMIFDGRGDDLRRLAREDALEPYEFTSGAGWCHGAPGIAMSRLRAYELTADPSLLGPVEAGIRLVLKNGQVPGQNYSLCHGLLGNAELLLDAGRLLGDPALVEAARETALRGVEAFEDHGRPWPSGVNDGTSDRGLLLGEAGVGFHLLRLRDRSIPSVLLIRPNPVDVPPPPRPDGPAAARQDLLAAFPRSARALGPGPFGCLVERAAADGDEAPWSQVWTDSTQGPAISPTERLYRLLREEGGLDPADELRYRLAFGSIDASEDLVRQAAYDGPPPAWARAALPPGVRYLPPRADAPAALLHAAPAGVREVPLVSPVAHLAFAELADGPRSLPDLLEAATGALEGTASSSPVEDRLRNSLSHQLALAHRNGLVRFWDHDAADIQAAADAVQAAQRLTRSTPELARAELVFAARSVLNDDGSTPVSLWDRLQLRARANVIAQHGELLGLMPTIGVDVGSALGPLPGPNEEARAVRALADTAGRLLAIYGSAPTFRLAAAPSLPEQLRGPLPPLSLWIGARRSSQVDPARWARVFAQVLSTATVAAVAGRGRSPAPFSLVVLDESIRTSLLASLPSGSGDILLLNPDDVAPTCRYWASSLGVAPLLDLRDGDHISGPRDPWDRLSAVASALVAEREGGTSVGLLPSQHAVKWLLSRPVDTIRGPASGAQPGPSAGSRTTWESAAVAYALLFSYALETQFVGGEDGPLLAAVEREVPHTHRALAQYARDGYFAPDLLQAL